MDAFKTDAILAGMSEEEKAELFGGLPALKEQREREALQDAARRALAAGVAALSKTPDGKRMFDYLIANYVLKFENVTALALRSDQALQLHASRDGQRELVQDLLRLVNEGSN